MGIREDVAALVIEGANLPDAGGHVPPVPSEDKRAVDKMEGSQEDTVEELDALKTKVAELESQLEQTRAEAQSQVQAAQADVASKDTVIASLQATVEQLRAQVTLGKRMGELRREFSSEEQQVVASMSDEQWTLFKRVGDAPVPPPFRQTMGGEEGAGASRVTLSRKV